MNAAPQLNPREPRISADASSSLATLSGAVGGTEHSTGSEGVPGSRVGWTGAGGELRVLDLFSGIGGFSLGLERTGGFVTVAFCEIEPFPRKVLAKHWPGIPIFDDVRELRGEDVGPVDVISGGFPCQPFSHAGKRRGVEDDRHLWPEMLRLIGECKPTWVIGENVGGLVSMVERRGPAKVESRSGGRHANGYDYESVVVRQEKMLLDSIAEDLGSIGYEVQPFVIPACAVGAPHRRDRCWIVAHMPRLQPGRSIERPERERVGAGGEPVAMANPSLRRFGGPDSREGELARRAETVGTGEDVADSERLAVRPGLRQDKPGGERRGRSGDRSCQALPDDGCRRGEGPGRGERGRSQPSRWLPEPDVGRVATGVPQRVDRLKALGNAVVPQIPELIGNAILAAEHAAQRGPEASAQVPAPARTPFEGCFPP